MLDDVATSLINVHDYAPSLGLAMVSVINTHYNIILNHVYIPMVSHVSGRHRNKVRKYIFLGDVEAVIRFLLTGMTVY